MLKIHPGIENELLDGAIDVLTERLDNVPFGMGGNPAFRRGKDLPCRRRPASMLRFR